MSKSRLAVPTGFPTLVREIKARIQQGQMRAIVAANAELVRLYWDIGRLIHQRQQQEGWGAAVIPGLSRELRNEMPEAKGLSERNIGRMIAFYRAYPDPAGILPTAITDSVARSILPQPAAKSTLPEKMPQPAAKLKASTKVPPPMALSRRASKVRQVAAEPPESRFWSIPWFHHVLLMEKVKDMPNRLWYVQQTLANGWSRSVLLGMIQSQAHLRQGQAISNFDRLLPPPQSDLVRQTLKDPYIFDFLTLEEPFRERELETNLLHQLERFLLELGQGFAFVGRQIQLEVGDDDFYIDLLFYHLKLRCFMVIDLKKGAFKPEYAGKMNFYLSVVDAQMRHDSDNPSIGLILCQDRNNIVAEYALRGMSKPIGISEYELTRALPANLRSSLPTVEEIEAELGESAGKQPDCMPAKKHRQEAKRSGRSQQKHSKTRGRK